MQKFDLRINCIAMPMTKGSLFAAWSLGMEVGFHDLSADWCHNGKIMGVRCESGYFKGMPPKDFIVTLALRDGGMKDIYIRTQD